MSTVMLSHPHRDLMLEAAQEQAIADSPEAEVLVINICKAMMAYSEFLADRGVIWDDRETGSEGQPRLRASALVASVDFVNDHYGGVDVKLKDGAVDRVYGNGRNPDPGFGPADIPHKPRVEEGPLLTPPPAVPDPA